MFGQNSVVMAGTPQRLQARINTTTVELGKPLTLTITYQSGRPLLNTLDIAPLQRDFHVIAPLSSERHGQQQRWQLRLYPYQTGIVTLPELELASMRTPSMQVTVTSPIDPKTHTAMEFNSTVSANTLWLKQALHINAEIDATVPLLVLDASHPTADNGILFIQPVTHELIATQLTRHRIGWTWFPQRTGVQSVGPLQVTLQRDGVITHTFYIRPSRIDVQPLPHYLPATLPVGRFVLQQTAPTTYSLFTQQLYTLGITSHAIDMLPSDIPELESQLPSTTAITLLTGTHQQHQAITSNSLVTTTNYVIPFSLVQSGIISPGKLRLQSLEPVSGRLQTYRLSLLDQFAVSPWLAIFIGVLCLGLGGTIILSLMRKLRRNIMRIRAYRRILQQLGHATSAQDLRQLIRHISATEAWPENQPLTTWLHNWQNKYGINNQAKELIFRLNRTLYQNRTEDITALAQRLRELCLSALAGFGWLRG